MIVVIGASGFIGFHLVKSLMNSGYEVLATGRRLSSIEYYKDNNIPCIEFDITNKDDFKKLPTENVEAVVLLAALLPANVTDYKTNKYVDVNILGTINALEYCKNNGIKKLISTTSYADVSGAWEKDVALKEDTPRNFSYSGDHASYIISKNAATDFILHYNAEFGMKGVVFRLPPVYGVGPHSEIYVDGKIYKSGFQIFIDKALTGQSIIIYGDKNVSRDIIYVKDVVSAILGVIKSDKTLGLYNLSSGVAITLEQQVKDIVNVFSKENNKSSILYQADKNNNSKSYLFDISKAKKDFNYMPQFSNFKELLIDYKNELNNSDTIIFFKDRKKD